MRPLKITINGVRGIVGDTLTPQIVTDFAQAVGTYVGGGKVLVSRDTRPSGEMVASCVFAGLIAAGCQAVDLGICPTPAMQLAVARSDAEAGVAITAGHNAQEWNALKVVDRDGLFLNRYQGGDLLDIYHQGEYRKAGWQELRPLLRDDEAAERHLTAIRRAVPADTVRRHGFKVAVDLCNGACCGPAVRLLEHLGCEVLAINDDPALPSPREPDPTLVNLGQLRALVTATDARIGFALDADGRRLGTVTEKGDVPGEEFTLCLVAQYLLPRRSGPVVTNLSTTQAVAEIARRHEREIIRTRIGQSYVAATARSQRAAVAGEGSGGVMFPELNYTHDGLSAMALILCHMAASGRPISELVGQVPRFHMVKSKVPCESRRVFTVLQRLRDELEARDEQEQWRISLLDGIHLSADATWVHVRASATEPLIRVIAEAQAAAEAQALSDEFVQRVRRLI
jgi:phosphomannomutase